MSKTVDEAEARARAHILAAKGVLDALSPERDDSGGGFLGLLLAIVLFPFTLWWRGYVIQALWGWFITPLNLPFAMPSIYVLIGILMTTRLFFPNPPLYKGHSTYGPGAILVAEWLLPLMALGAGWVWQWLGWWT